MDLSAIVDIIKLIVPAAAAIIAVHYVLNSFKEKETKHELIQLKNESLKIVMPLRLQAYERMCMFLERIRLDAIIIRVNAQGMNGHMLQKAVLDEVRNEFNHNLSQQVYLSENAWNLIKNAAEATKGVMISSFQEINKEGLTNHELAQHALNRYFSYSPNPIDEALSYIKKEIQEKF